MTPRRSARIDEQQSRKKHASSKDALLVLPTEIQQNILQYVDDFRAMINLACTSKRHYDLAMSVVHKHITLTVGTSDHYIPNFIRHLEPHLSIAQKKRLKREGRYDGQQETFSNLLDPDAVPNCALNVRHMTIDGIHPRKKHKPILIRYLEEVLKNLSNLEALSITELNESMSHSIVALKHLTALRVTDQYMRSISEDEASPLAQLRGLEYLAFSSEMFGEIVTGQQRVFQTILARSLSTLRTLHVGTTREESSFLEEFEDRITEHDPDALTQPHYLTALKSLTLCGHCWKGERALLWTELDKSINFLQLRELKLIRLGEGKLILFKHLVDLFSKADKHSIQLRKLSLDMYPDPQNLVTSEGRLEDAYRFIASFDTLTSLSIYEHNKFLNNRFGNPGLSRTLQQAIIIHKELETLRFKYEGGTPYFSAEAVEILTKNLPVLRILEIPPEYEDSVDAMARSISQAKELRTLIVPILPTSPYPDQSGNTVRTFIKTLIGCLLQVSGDIEDFTWTKAYNLTEIRTTRYDVCQIYRDAISEGIRDTFAIGYGFKPQGKMNPPVEISKGDKAVWIQDVGVIEGGKQCYYTADSSWASQIMTSIK